MRRRRKKNLPCLLNHSTGIVNDTRSETADRITILDAVRSEMKSGAFNGKEGDLIQLPKEFTSCDKARTASEPLSESQFEFP